LLLLSFLCLGSWANTVKASAGTWRFELYSFDFAIGAIALATLAAWTLGTLGSDLSFIDRTAVAGLRSQALAMSAGSAFGIGNTLLIATVSLLGMGSAFLLVLSITLAVWALAGATNAQPFALAAALVAFILAAILLILARYERRTHRVRDRKTPSELIPKSTKGILTGVLAGILTGLSHPLAELAFWGDLGLGPYAGLLMFCIGIVASTVLFGFFLLNIGIEGGRLRVSAYAKGGIRPHLFGLCGGALWGAGMLLELLAQSVPVAQRPAYSTTLAATQGSVILASLWGIAIWGEFRALSAKSKSLIVLAVVLFCVGIACLAFRFSR
jgi:glucose uptake protein